MVPEIFILYFLPKDIENIFLKKLLSLLKIWEQ